METGLCMVSQSFSFVTYMYFLLGMVGEDTTALLQGVSLQEVVSKRMENGSVNAYAVLPLHAETGTRKFFFTSCYTCKSRCTCLRIVQEFALQERICTATFQLKVLQNL